MKLQGTRLRAWSGYALRGLALGLAVIGAPSAAVAQTTNAMVVTSDRGGLLGQRRDAIQLLRASGQRVELRGLCLSACTMYLSLPNVCVSPTATFGFHGPSRNQKRLPQSEFEHWSAVMADTYREPLRSWYLSEARYTITGYHKISGADLIGMGYPSC